MEDTFEEEKQKFLLELKTWISFDELLEKYSNKIRSNKELILLLLPVNKNIYELKYISDELRKDKDIFLLAGSYNIESFHYYAHEDLKKDEEFILKLFKLDMEVLSYITPELLDNEYFLWHINELCTITDRIYLSKIINTRIFEELCYNPDYLDEFASPVNCKPARYN